MKQRGLLNHDGWVGDLRETILREEMHVVADRRSDATLCLESGLLRNLRDVVDGQRNRRALERVEGDLPLLAAKLLLDRGVNRELKETLFDGGDLDDGSCRLSGGEDFCDLLGIRFLCHGSNFLSG